MPSELTPGQQRAANTQLLAPYNCSAALRMACIHTAAAMTVCYSQDGASVCPAAVMRKVDRHLIPWFFTLGIFCYLDRTNLR